MRVIASKNLNQNQNKAEVNEEVKLSNNSSSESDQIIQKQNYLMRQIYFYSGICQNL